MNQKGQYESRIFIFLELLTVKIISGNKSFLFCFIKFLHRFDKLSSKLYRSPTIFTLSKKQFIQNDYLRR